MLRPSMRGGVPVFRRSTTNGPSRRRCASVVAGGSPARPPAYGCSGRRGSCRPGRCRRSAPRRRRRNAGPIWVITPRTRSPSMTRSSTACWNSDRLGCVSTARRIAALYRARSAWQRVARTAGPFEAFSVRHWMPAAVGGLRHDAAERVDLLDQVALADAADGRVAAHLRRRFRCCGSAAACARRRARRPARPRCRHGRHRSRSRRSVAGSGS